MLSFLLYFFTWITIVALAAGSFGSGQILTRLTGVQPLWLMVITWMYLALLRLRGNLSIYSKQYTVIPRILLGISAIATLILSVWGYVTPPNYVYALTRIQPQNLGLVPVFLGGILFLTQHHSWWKTYYKHVLFWGPVGVLFCLLMISFWPFDYFDQLVKEDHLVEYLQVLVLVFGAFIALRRLMLKRLQMRAWEVAILGLGIATLLFVAGDEISWGQRLLGLTTPEQMAAVNLQKEITLHNLQSVQWGVEIAYAAIGVLGGTVWAISHLPIFRKLGMLIPSRYLLWFFIVPGIYYLYPVYSSRNMYGEWAEVMELLLYTGIAVHFSMISFAFGKKLVSD